MPDSKQHGKKKDSRIENAAGGLGNANVEVTPTLPTSGQILGAVVRCLGITHPDLGNKTAQRYFSGRPENRVMESSRAKIITAISEILAVSVFAVTPGQEIKRWSDSSLIAKVLDWHTVNWDRFRAFLQPRMMRVYPDHLAQVWQAYTRLATIDLAVRAAAHIHIAHASPDALEFLPWTGVSQRGKYLNRKRTEAKVSLSALAESTDVSDNTVDAWMYNGVRPSDDNLANIAKTLTSNIDSDACTSLLRELRKLYWASDLAGLLSDFIGVRVAEEIVGRLYRYASLLCGIINDRIDTSANWDVLNKLATLGTQFELSDPLLAALVPHEPDSEWKEDLMAASSNWTRRVLMANLSVYRVEVNDLICQTEGRLLKDWGIGNPDAYAHYQRSEELQIQGRIHEAIDEVARAAELDPLDPVYHCTLGSAKGKIGAKQGDATLVKEGLEACWLAVTLDPTWILPWAEIGFILLNSDKPKEAVNHLKAVRPECGPLDTRYYTALGSALREAGQYQESLSAFEASLKLNPDDLPVVMAAAFTAALVGDKAKSNRYRKMARYLGASHELDILLESAKT